MVTKKKINRRAQPYRLDWEGTPASIEEMSARLARFWDDADEMFQILFDDLQATDVTVNEAKATPVVSSGPIIFLDPSSGAGGGGEDGEQGPPGPQGSQGPQGPTGATGASGQSVMGPQGPEGLPGDDGFDGFSILGPQGAQGVTGATGATGPSGMAGPPGLDGAPGEDGADGISIPGPQGSIGATGPTGPTGATGAGGPMGPPGPDGLDGADGYDGVSVPGPQGAQGVTGATGPTGPTGAVGPMGLTGEPGDDGLDSLIPGPQGVQGPTGATGPAGSGGMSQPPGFLEVAPDEYVEPLLLPIGDNTAAGLFGGSLAEPRTISTPKTIVANTSEVIVGPVTILTGQTITFQDAKARLQILGGGAPSYMSFTSGSMGTTDVINPSGVEYMMGFSSAAGSGTGLATSVTPIRTGKVLFVMQGVIIIAAGVFDENTIRFRYGTGSAPLFRDTPSGVIATSSQISLTANAAAGTLPFSMSVIVTGLFVGTAYWTDLSITGAAATFSVNRMRINAVELQ